MRRKRKKEQGAKKTIAPLLYVADLVHHVRHTGNNTDSHGPSQVHGEKVRLADRWCSHLNGTSSMESSAMHNVSPYGHGQEVITQANHQGRDVGS